MNPNTSPNPIHSLDSIRRRLFLCLSVAIPLFSAWSAVAALQTNMLVQAGMDSGWAMVYDSTRVSGVSYTANANWNRIVGGSDRLMGTLSLTKTFDTLSPISLYFIELAAATNDNFGFRMNLNETVVNQSGINWSGFRMDVTDTNRVYDDEDGTSHPSYAHLHPGNSWSVSPFTPTPSNGNGYKSVILSGGTFADNSTNNWTGIALHQYEENAMQRPFTLIETPIAVPEPTALALVLVGAAGLVARITRRRSAIT